MLTGTFTLDSALTREVTRLRRIMGKVVTQPKQPLSDHLFEFVVAAIMIKAGDVDLQQVHENEVALRLRSGFTRSPGLVVQVCLTLEAAIHLQVQGLELNVILAQAIEPDNWRRPEALPGELVRLVKKYRRDLAAEFSEVRRISLGEMWWMLLPRLVHSAGLSAVTLTEGIRRS